MLEVRRSSNYRQLYSAKVHRLRRLCKCQSAREGISIKRPLINYATTLRGETNESLTPPVWSLIVSTVATCSPRRTRLQFRSSQPTARNVTIKKSKFFIFQKKIVSDWLTSKRWNNSFENFKSKKILFIESATSWVRNKWSCFGYLEHTKVGSPHSPGINSLNSLRNNVAANYSIMLLYIVTLINLN